MMFYEYAFVLQKCLKGADPRPKGSWVKVVSTKEDFDAMQVSYF